VTKTLVDSSGDEFEVRPVRVRKPEHGPVEPVERPLDLDAVAREPFRPVVE
jgi:hypothetical protein